MSDEPSIAFNINNSNINQAAAKIENNNSHIGDVYAGGDVSPQQFFAAISAEVAKLPDSQRAQVSESIKPIESLACGGVPQLQKSVPNSTLQKYLDALRPHAALIGRCLAAFTEASLTTLAASNPIVAGVVAIAKEVRK